MIAVSSRFTMAGAETIASEKSERRTFSRREALIRASREWERRQAEKRQYEDQQRLRAEAQATRNRESIRHNTPSKEALRGIIDLVARMHGATYEQVIAKGRSHHVVNARQAAMCAVKQQRPEYSLHMLGRLFHRDHTTILYALQQRGVK